MRTPPGSDRLPRGGIHRRRRCRGRRRDAVDRPLADNDLVPLRFHHRIRGRGNNPPHRRGPVRAVPQRREGRRRYRLDRARGAFRRPRGRRQPPGAGSRQRRGRLGRRADGRNRCRERAVRQHRDRALVLERPGAGRRRLADRPRHRHRTGLAASADGDVRPVADLRLPEPGGRAGRRLSRRRRDQPARGRRPAAAPDRRREPRRGRVCRPGRDNRWRSQDGVEPDDRGSQRLRPYRPRPPPKRQPGARDHRGGRRRRARRQLVERLLGPDQRRPLPLDRGGRPVRNHRLPRDRSRLPGRHHAPCEDRGDRGSPRPVPERRRGRGLRHRFRRERQLSFAPSRVRRTGFPEELRPGHLGGGGAGADRPEPAVPQRRSGHGLERAGAAPIRRAASLPVFPNPGHCCSTGRASRPATTAALRLCARCSCSSTKGRSPPAGRPARSVPAPSRWGGIPRSSTR